MLTLNKAHLVVNNQIPQAAIEIMQDVEAYRRGELKTTPYNKGMDEMIQELKHKYANH